MKFEPTTEQASFINHAIASGRFQVPEEAVSDALDLWLERERARMEILAAFDAAEASIAGGQCYTYTKEELPKLAEDLKRKAREHRDQP